MNTAARHRQAPEYPRTGGPISSPARADGTDTAGPLSGLLVHPAAADRVRRHLAEAEVLFVARVVRDGGIGPWRLQVRERVLAAHHALGSGGRVSRTATADLVVSLLDQHVRDWCWLQVETEPGPVWTALWLHLVRHALSPLRAEPLFLLGWTAWRCHDVALSRAATAAARAEDPAHDAARMLEELLDRDVDPTDLPSLAEWPGPEGGS